MEATFYYNGMTGGPAPGTAGAGDLITVLDACLVNGFNTVTLTSITRSGSTATATYTSHGFKAGQLVYIAGANETEYNGNQRVLTVPDANTFTFTVSGTPATPATGTITAKTPGLGWTKDYTGTNLATYRPAAGNRRWLRVDDTPTNNSIILGYNDMTAVSTGTDPFPATSFVAASGLRVAKPNDTLGWFLIGNDRCFYLVAATNSSYWNWMFFGDAPSYKSGDTDNTMIAGCHVSSDTTSNNQTNVFFTNNYGGAPNTAGNGPILYRDYTGTLTIGTTGAVLAAFGTTGTYFANKTTGIFNAGPSPISGGYHIGMIDALEVVSSANHPRMRMPGMLSVPTKLDYVTYDKTYFPNVATFGGIILKSCDNVSGGTAAALVFALCDWETVFATGV